jgi:hypothetical protein
MIMNDGVTLKEIGQHWKKNAVPFAPKAKVLVNTDGATWTIDGGDTNTYQNGQSADIVTNATYTITTSKGAKKTVRVDNEGEVISVDLVGGGSGGGGGGCNIGAGFNTPILIPTFLLCSLFLMRRKNK